MNRGLFCSNKKSKVYKFRSCIKIGKLKNCCLRIKKIRLLKEIQTIKWWFSLVIKPIP